MVTGLEVTFAIPAKTKKRPEKIRLNRRYFCYQRCHSGLRSTTGPVATIGTGRLGGGLPLPQGSIAANLRKIILVTLQFFLRFHTGYFRKRTSGHSAFRSSSGSLAIFTASEDRFMPWPLVQHPHALADRQASPRPLPSEGGEYRACVVETVASEQQALAQPASLNGWLFGSKRDRKIAASIGSAKQ